MNCNDTWPILLLICQQLSSDLFWPHKSFKKAKKKNHSMLIMLSRGVARSFAYFGLKCMKTSWPVIITKFFFLILFCLLSTKQGKIALLSYSLPFWWKWFIKKYPLNLKANNIKKNNQLFHTHTFKVRLYFFLSLDDGNSKNET